jgi:hypothetical protein
MVPFVSSDGKLLMMLYIVATDGDSLSESITEDTVIRIDEHSTRSTPRRYWAFTSNGCMNHLLWNSAVRALIELWHELHARAPVYVFGQGLAGHRYLPTIFQALQHHMYMWSLPKNCGQCMQPLAALPLQHFERRIGALLGADGALEFDSTFGSSDARQQLFACAADAEQETFKSGAIRRAFEVTG